jgi:hypothetical protein
LNGSIGFDQAQYWCLVNESLVVGVIGLDSSLIYRVEGRFSQRLFEFRQPINQSSNQLINQYLLAAFWIHKARQGKLLARFVASSLLFSVESSDVNRTWPLCSDPARPACDPNQWSLLRELVSSVIGLFLPFCSIRPVMKTNKRIATS